MVAWGKDVFGSSELGFSRVLPGVGLVLTAMMSVTVSASETAGYYTDSVTGIVYRKVVQTVETPVVETTMQTRQSVVSVPKTVTETTPAVQTTYQPVIREALEPYMSGRWNPFRQPAVAYRNVTSTQWQATSRVVQQSRTRVDWVPETRTVQVPQQTIRYQRQQHVSYQQVSQVNNLASAPIASPAIVARLQPLPAGTNLAASSGGFSARAAAPGSPRSVGQRGLQATDLSSPQPQPHVWTPPAIPTTDIATRLAPTLFR